MRPGLAISACAGALALAASALGQPSTSPPSARDYRPPPGIAFKATDFISDNVRLTAQWFYAAGNEGRKLPTVILAHGPDDTPADFRQDAVDLAQAGYLVMLFDYRGWGDSDGRVVLTGPKSGAGGTMNAQVRELRGYIDPWEQVEDWFNAISFAVANPMVDAGHIGIRGSSLSGGHVIYVAAHDKRVKALVSQVSSLDLRPYKPYQPDPAKVMADADAASARLATGQAQYPERGRAARDPLAASVGNKLVRWAPIEQAHRVTTPALFVLAENEELFSNTNNGLLACDRVAGPRKMVMMPKITHFDIYGVERERAIGVAIDWFDKYLKPPAGRGARGAGREEPERGDCMPEPPPPKGEEDVDGSGDSVRVQDASGRWN